MNPAAIWWGQIGNCLRLLTDVTNCFRDSRSAVLELPARLPWPQELRDRGAIRRTALGQNRELQILPWQEHREPGDFVLRELCSWEEQSDYYPGDSWAAYLGSREDLELNEQDIWITGIHRREDLLKWCTFLTEYERVSAQLPERAVFVLEYDGPPVSNPGIEHIVFRVEDYDCRVFCLEAAAALNNTRLRAYQAELALHISGTDPEFCWELLQLGEALLKDPVAATREALARSRDFGQLSEQQTVSAAWRSAVVLFFPVLEQWRMDCIRRNAEELQRQLPITDSNGESITELEDLELGNLYYIRKNRPGCKLSQEDKVKIDLCRHARNLLAHNKMICLEDARRIMEL